MSVSRYDHVADWYDLYVTADLDLPYFRRAAAGARHVLELMAGTGRVSLAMADTACKTVTCVDRSFHMLRQVHRKATGHPKLRVVCADVCALPLHTGYDLVAIPFNSLAEVTDAQDRIQLVSEIWRVLVPGGVFICTLHNPAVRRRTLDEVPRTVGPLQGPAESTLLLTITGSIDQTTGIATSEQTLTRTDGSRVLEERTQSVRFALLTDAETERLVLGRGFEKVALHGDYDEQEFDPEHSPYMIWQFRRPLDASS